MVAYLTAGERRHETCRYGALAQAWRGEPGDWTPTVMPLCYWKPDGPVPPALARSWGGAIEYDRDCAVCQCHQEIEI